MDNKATKSFHLKFQQLVLFTIYPQMSCLGLNFLMSNIYFTHFLLSISIQRKEKDTIKLPLCFQPNFYHRRHVYLCPTKEKGDKKEKNLKTSFKYKLEARHKLQKKVKTVKHYFLLYQVFIVSCQNIPVNHWSGVPRPVLPK